MSMHSPRPTGAARAAALAAAAMCGALFAQAVNLKPGKYEFVSTSQVTLAPEMQKRLPPGYLARLQKPRTQQQCITDVDLKQVGKQLSQGRGNYPSCKMTEHSVAGDKVKRSEEHTSELQSRLHLVCRLLLEKKKNKAYRRSRAVLSVRRLFPV